MKALTINYNTPELLDRMLSGFRKFYDIDMLLVDGSDKKYPETLEVVNKYTGIETHHFSYNIHHGPGLAYGFSQIIDDRIIVIDTDIVFYRGGAIEMLDERLKDDSYGIGDIQTVNSTGFNVQKGIPYLHPAFMLVNRKIVIQWPMPIKHGAPMIETMTAIHQSGKDILQHAPEITNDFRNKDKYYITHDWQGTVSRTGGYHL
jgi:hypothetical protein